MNQTFGGFRVTKTAPFPIILKDVGDLRTSYNIPIKIPLFEAAIVRSYSC
jgi:hypothetical protein